MTTPPTTTYQAEMLIGAGELGQVFRARRQADGQQLAQKVFHGRVATKAGFQERLRRVAPALVTLRGEGIVPVYEVAADPSHYFVAMEHLPEGSLRGLLQQRARASEGWPLAGPLDLARQVADALAVAHRERVPHRNLKPSNVLLAPAPLPLSGPAQRRAMLSDFGVFRLAEEVIAAPGPLSFDTLAYASPEWFQGAEPDEHSDIYGLGVLIYEIVTGYPPFEGRTFNDAWKIRDAYALPASALQRPDLPAALHELILACLSKDPAGRPEYAGEVSARLADVIRDLPDLPPLPPPSPLDEERVLVIPRVYKLGSQQQPTAVYDLSGDGLTVGSDPASDTIVLDAAQVAAQQLQIDWLGDQVKVTLLAERDDALLEDRPLVPHQPETWVAGTMLRLGPFYLRLDLPDAAPALPIAPVPAPDQAAVPSGASAMSEPAAPDEMAVAEAAAEGYSCALVLPEPPELLVVPGTVALYKLTLINIGKQTDHFEVEVEGAPKTAQITVLPRRRPQLNQNDTQEVALSIDVPRRHDSAAGKYSVTIVARSTSRNDEIAGQTTALWEVQPFYVDGLKLGRTDTKGRGLLRTSYPLTVVNEGNAKLRYQLVADDADEALSYQWRDGQNELQVDPGRRPGTTVALRPLRLHLYGRPIRHPFSVTLVRDELHELRRDAVYEQLALIPWWLPFVAAVIMAVAIWFALLPRIELIDPAGAATVNAGKPQIFSARIRNAQTVQVLYGRTPQTRIRILRPLAQTPFTSFFSDTVEFTNVYSSGDRLTYELVANGLLPFQREVVQLELTIVPPPPTPTSTPIPTAIPPPAIVQTRVVTQIVIATLPPPTVPPPSATPVVRNCERGASYTLSGPANPNEVVLLEYNGREVDGQIVGPDGRYRLRFSVPQNEVGGTVVIRAVTDDGNARGEMQCFVALPPPTPEPTATRAQSNVPLLPTNPPQPLPSLPTPLVRPAPTP